MSTTSADLPASSAPVVQRPLTLLTRLGTLVRRELWEHPSLWRAPLIIAGLLLGTILLGVMSGSHHTRIQVDGWDFNQSPERQAQAFAVSQVAPMLPLYLIMTLVLTFYLLDSLYAERKDRSILFWKSLPVSDGLTVFSKFFVALIVVPLGVLVLAAACQLLLFLLWQVGVALGRFPPGLLTWHTLMWLKVEGVMLVCFVLGALWYAPMAAAFLLVSAWARRSPVMWVTLATAAPLVLESVFGTHYIARFLGYRSLGIWALLGTGLNGERLEHGARLEGVLGDLNFAAAFGNIDLWLGVAVAIALLYVTMRVRRYRDDTAG
jgi:ABC-2 type transport system permease protein